MGIEIERKFLIQGEGWRQLGTGTPYRQGYLVNTKDRTVRVRVAGDQGYLTIKGSSDGIQRSEYEYAIPLSDANELLDTLCQRPFIEKTRYRIPYQDVVWEVDEFSGANQGLIVAEVELKDPNQPLDLPEWIGSEVSDDPRYFNANLVSHPFSQW
jgi:adenylate cyclase